MRGPAPRRPETDELLVKLRKTTSLTWDEIARKSGIPSGRIARARFQRIMTRHETRTGQTRDCRCCSKPFHSPHAGVRMCDPCRTDAAKSYSPYEPVYA